MINLLKLTYFIGIIFAAAAIAEMSAILLGVNITSFANAVILFVCGVCMVYFSHKLDKS
jgi:hypothetical protein